MKKLNKNRKFKHNIAIIPGDGIGPEVILASIKVINKALELDNTYTATYLNLVGLILEGEGPIVEEMNKLVTSRKRSDLDKYDQLEEQRIGLYKECLPYLEKLIEIDPTNIEALKTAKNIYYTTDDLDNFKLMNVKLQELEN